MVVTGKRKSILVVTTGKRKSIMLVTGKRKSIMVVTGKRKSLMLVRVDTPMGTQAPMGMHFYIYDYQVKSTDFFNFSSELRNSSSIHTLYLQCFIGTESHSVRSIPQKKTNNVGFDRSSYNNCKDIELTLFQFNHICMYIIKNFFCRINNRGLGAPSTIFERLKKSWGKWEGAVRPNRILKRGLNQWGCTKVDLML